MERKIEPILTTTTYINSNNKRGREIQLDNNNDNNISFEICDTVCGDLTLRYAELQPIYQYLIAKKNNPTTTLANNDYEQKIEKFRLVLNECQDIPLFKGRWFLGGAVSTIRTLESEEDGSSSNGRFKYRILEARYCLFQDIDIDNFIMYIHSNNHYTSVHMNSLIRRLGVFFNKPTLRIRECMKNCVCQQQQQQQQQLHSHMQLIKKQMLHQELHDHLGLSPSSPSETIGDVPFQIQQLKEQFDQQRKETLMNDSLTRTFLYTLRQDVEKQRLELQNRIQSSSSNSYNSNSGDQQRLFELDRKIQEMERRIQGGTITDYQRLSSLEKRIQEMERRLQANDNQSFFSLERKILGGDHQYQYGLERKIQEMERRVQDGERQRLRLEGKLQEMEKTIQQQQLQQQIQQIQLYKHYQEKTDQEKTEQKKQTIETNNSTDTKEQECEISPIAPSKIRYKSLNATRVSFITPTTLYLNESDLQLVQSNERWLNDNIINGYISKLLRIRFNREEEYNRIINIYTTYSFTNHPNRTIQPATLSIYPVLSIIPYNVNNTHWSLFIVRHGNNQRLLSFDPLVSQGNSRYHDFSTIIRNHFGIKSIDNQKLLTVLVQKDSYNCGILILAMIEHLLNRMHQFTYHTPDEDLFGNIYPDAFNPNQYRERVHSILVDKKGIKNYLNWSLPMKTETIKGTPQTLHSIIKETQPTTANNSHVDVDAESDADEDMTDYYEPDIQFWNGEKPFKIEKYQDSSNVERYIDSDKLFNNNFELDDITNINKVIRSGVISSKYKSIICDSKRTFDERVILAYSLLPYSEFNSGQEFVKELFGYYEKSDEDDDEDEDEDENQSDDSKYKIILSLSKLFVRNTQKYLKQFENDRELTREQYIKWFESMENLGIGEYDPSLAVPLLFRIHKHSYQILISYPSLCKEFPLLYMPVWVNNATFGSKNFRSMLFKYKAIHNLQYNRGAKEVTPKKNK